MAPNGTAEIHNDAWQTDAYTWAGPLGRAPVVSSTLINHDCGSITVDAQGRLVSVCVGLSGPELYLFDAHTLATLATFALPPRQSLPSDPTSVFQDFTGGGYFYLGAQDRVVTSTTTRHILVIADTGTGFTQVARPRPQRRAHLLRTDHLGIARLPRPAVVRDQGRRSGGNAEPRDRRGSRQAPGPRQRRGDRELVRRRSARRRLHRHRSAPLSIHGGEGRRTADHLVGEISQQRQGQARPGRRRHGDDAHGDAGRLRQHHRQRRSHGRRRLPDGRPPRTAAAGVQGPGVSPRRE